MKFSRENYELYVLDFLDGKLLEEDQKMFIKFLKDHPDIYEEVMDIINIKLQPGETLFPGKHNLKNIGKTLKYQDDFENYCIASLEGDLEPDEKLNFDNYLSENPDKASELESFRKVYLKADKSITFSLKSKLKKLSIIQKRIRLVSIISTAAAILILLIIFINPSNKIIRNISQENQKELQVTNDIITTEKGSEQSDMDANAIHQPELTDNQSAEKKLNNTLKAEQVFALKLRYSPTISQYTQIDSGRTIISIKPVSSLQALLEIKKSEVPDKLILPSLERNGVFREYQTLGEFAGEHILSSLFPRMDSDTRLKMTFWDLASSSFEGLNRISEGGYALNREINENGYLKRISFETPVVGISLPVKNKSAQ